jgi:hypothetical protein
MADRYLYFILPGLFGGALFAGREVWLRAAPRLPRQSARVGAVAALALALAFAAHARDRARLWASPLAILADSAARWPEGRTAEIVRARRAAQLGDADTAIAALRRAWERGFNRFEQLQTDPALAGLQGDPRFQALVREIAGWWVAQLSTLDDPTQLELRTLAVAHLARGDRAAAIVALERALAHGGPIDDRIRAELAEIRRAGG